MALIGQAGRFLLAGGALTIVGYLAILVLSLVMGVSPFAANAIVYFLGLIVSYFLNAKYVFKDSAQFASFAKFVGSFLIAYLANLFVLAIVLNRLEMPVWVSQLMATATYAAVQFGLSRSYVFQTRYAASADS